MVRSISLSPERQSPPFPGYLRQPLDNFSAKQDFIHVAHVQHINDSAEVGLPTFPPGIVRVDDEIMLHVDPFVLSQLFKFHAIQQGFIHTVGNAAAKCRREVILLHFPDRQGIQRTGKRASTRRDIVLSGPAAEMTVVSCRGSKSHG